MKLRSVTSKSMKALDRCAIEDYKIPGLLLMENAGRGIAEMAARLIPKGRVTIVCGKGNNGGDGLVAARHLHNRGFDVLVVLATEPKSLKPDAAVNYEIVNRMKIPVTVITQYSEVKNLEETFKSSDLVIDALFGIGLERNIVGLEKSLIETINRFARKVLAVDVPSGLNSDTGQVMGAAVKAAYTATLAAAKKGLFLNQGPEHSGKIEVIDIGIPREELERAFAGA